MLAARKARLVTRMRVVIVVRVARVVSVLRRAVWKGGGRLLTAVWKGKQDPIEKLRSVALSQCLVAAISCQSSGRRPRQPEIRTRRLHTRADRSRPRAAPPAASFSSLPSPLRRAACALLMPHLFGELVNSSLSPAAPAPENPADQHGALVEGKRM